MLVAFNDVSVGIALAIFRRHESRPDQRQADLPAMGMARERQRDPFRHARKNVRLVREQDDRIVGCELLQRTRQVVDAAEAATADAVSDLIADARDPESLALTAEQDRMILQ